MYRVAKFFLLAAVIAVSAPTSARAEGYVSPWAGVQFGSNVASGRGDLDTGRGGFGVNAGGMGAGIIGGEVGFGFNPSFFGSKSEFGDNNVMDLMGNIIIGIPIGGTRGGGFRPFVTGGLGMIRLDHGSVFDNVDSSNHFAYNLGAGAMGFFNNHVGIRGDVRYLQTLNGSVVDLVDNNGVDFGVFDRGGFHYWRLSAGAVIL